MELYEKKKRFEIKLFDIRTITHSRREINIYLQISNTWGRVLGSFAFLKNPEAFRETKTSARRKRPESPDQNYRATKPNLGAKTQRINIIWFKRHPSAD